MTPYANEYTFVSEMCRLLEKICSVQIGTPTEVSELNPIDQNRPKFNVEGASIYQIDNDLIEQDRNSLCKSFASTKGISSPDKEIIKQLSDIIFMYDSYFENINVFECNLKENTKLSFDFEVIIF
jgi:hypothetical protein